MSSYFQCRFVSKIVKHPYGQKVVTFSDHELGRMYPLHGQKTLKSYQTKYPTLHDAIVRAKELNLGKHLSQGAIGIVIVQHKSSGDYTLCEGTKVKPHLRSTSRKLDTAEWLRFINSKGEMFELEPKKHIILRKLA